MTPTTSQRPPAAATPTTTRAIGNVDTTPAAPARDIQAGARTGSDVLALARSLSRRHGGADSPRGPDGNRGPVQRALQQMAAAYNATNDTRRRQEIAADADRLMGAAVRVGFLRGGHTGFVDYASRRAAPRAAPEPTAAAQASAAGAPTTPASAPAAPPPRKGAQVGFDGQPIIRPAGTGSGGRTVAEQFAGVSIGTQPRERAWFVVPGQPGAGMSVGVSTPGIGVDANGHVDVRSPLATALGWWSDGKQAVQGRVQADLEPLADGSRGWLVGGSYVRKPASGWESRADVQVGSPEPALVGAQAGRGGVKWSAQAQQFVPLDGKATNRLQLRTGAASSGRSGEPVGYFASATVNPAPLNAGHFGTSPRTTVGGGVTYEATPVPTATNLGRMEHRTSVQAHGISDRFRGSVAVVHSTTDPALPGTGARRVDRVQMQAAAQVRVGRNDVGQPPTDQTGISQDMPTGVFKPGEKGRNTTLFGSVTHTVSSNAPPPAVRPAFASGDAAKLGVITARSEGLLRSASVVATADLDRGGVGVRGVANLQPVQGVPVFVALEGEHTPDRTTVGAYGVVMPTDNSYVKAGVEHVVASDLPGEQGDNRLVVKTGIRF